MKYKEFKDGISISRLGMGNMRLPVIDGDQGNIDYEKGQAIIDECIKGGVTYFDTAYNYHNKTSEIFVGKALSKYPRDSFFVADKFNYMANPDYKEEFADQLSKLQMDYIDFYLLHGVGDALAETIEKCGCIDYFNQMKAEGKIRYFGFSFHGSCDCLKHLLTLNKWDFVQIQLNYYDWHLETAKEQYEILTAAGIPVMVMEPAHGGMLANLEPSAAEVLTKINPDCSLASFAMRWVMGLDNVQVVLSGMSTVEQAADNIKTFSEAVPMTDAEKDAVKLAAETQKAAVTVPCTACRYCCPDCPKQIDIPEILKVYNAYKLSGAFALMKLNQLPEDKQPSACVGCGSCTRHCPQSIDVPAIMKEIAGILEKMKK